MKFPIEAFSRYCLMHGIDELGYLLSQAPVIEEYEQRQARRDEGSHRGARR